MTAVFFRPEEAVTAEQLKALGFSRSPFTSLVVPRPIGWISTLSPEGVANLAPFSFFNMVAQAPPMVMYCANGSHPDGREKDSLRNARETGEFVANLATWDLRQQMNASSAAGSRNADEFGTARLAKAPSRIVRAPRVAESPVNLECTVIKIVELPEDPSSGARNNAIFGRIVGVHIDAALIAEGRVRIASARPLARLGYLDYATLGDGFAMDRPD